MMWWSSVNYSKIIINYAMLWLWMTLFEASNAFLSISNTNLHSKTFSLTAHQATVAPENQEASQQHQHNTDSLTCKLCNATFATRNAMFRHLRGQDAGSDCHIKAAELGMEGTKSSLTKELSLTAVIRYGYLVENEDALHKSASSCAAYALYNLDDTSEIQYKVGINDIVATVIHEAFVNLTDAYLKKESHSIELSTTALSWSTAAKLRQPSLRQDNEVLCAVSEVLSFNYRVVLPQSSNAWNDYAESEKLFSDLQSTLDTRMDGVKIQLHAMDAGVPRSAKFEGERGCSQRSYRCLLPIRWLNFQSSNEYERKELINWVKGITEVSERKHQPRGDTVKAPQCIMKLKQALKAAESRTVPNRRMRRQTVAATSSSIDENADVLDASSGPIRLSQGRFGQLWRKERRCWSNFCHPDLRGMAASPSHDSTWRTMDKASIVDIVNMTHPVEGKAFDELHNVHIVLEFRGDSFLLGEIPRVISTIVAMSNDWIPTNFFELATRSDIYIEAPPMPPFVNRMLYFHSPRYHFHELTSSSGEQMFEKCISGSSTDYDWEMAIRNELSLKSSLIKQNYEQKWLSTLRDDVSATIIRDMQADSKNRDDVATDQIEMGRENEPMIDLLSHCPEGAHSNTLELLREIVKKEQWPTTSMARSRVIASSRESSTESILTNKKGSVASSFPGKILSSGSFTVVNMELWKEGSGIPLPAANSHFPELAKSVFDLEKEIIENQLSIPIADGMTKPDTIQRRSPSTHCAVNRNARFTPHVDSGRGAGQTVSMILGLGDYTGGEIMVEGKPYEIRYNALEFDGWRQIHWTAPFVGERYSLVFFTPELTTEVKSGEPAQSLDLSISNEKHAAYLAKLHNSKIQFLPPLTFRKNSTDSLVIGEILDPERGCSYELGSNKIPAMPHGFSVKGHTTVLDIGGHIGIFSRYAIEQGVNHIISYEPESSNFDLLLKNLSPAVSSAEISIELHPKAVGVECAERTLVRARNENDGKVNTWRHSLVEYTQYVDRSTKLPSASQKGNLDRINVQCQSFFQDVLRPGITFVKLDCEGAEIEILLSHKASMRSSWLDVTHLVVEWSITKERRVDVFHEMLANLRSAGFDVYYDGMGGWWDTNSSVLWPYNQDILIFATMRN